MVSDHEEPKQVGLEPGGQQQQRRSDRQVKVEKEPVRFDVFRFVESHVTQLKPEQFVSPLGGEQHVVR